MISLFLAVLGCIILGFTSYTNWKVICFLKQHPLLKPSPSHKNIHIHSQVQFQHWVDTYLFQSVHPCYHGKVMHERTQGQRNHICFNTCYDPSEMKNIRMLKKERPFNYTYASCCGDVKLWWLCGRHREVPFGQKEQHDIDLHSILTKLEFSYVREMKNGCSKALPKVIIRRQS